MNNCKECGRKIGDAISIKTIDPCIEPYVKALNNAGFETYWSCCGHGEIPGIVMLKNGQVIRLFRNKDEHLAVFPVMEDGK